MLFYLHGPGVHPQAGELDDLLGVYAHVLDAGGLEVQDEKVVETKVVLPAVIQSHHEQLRLEPSLKQIVNQYIQDYKYSTKKW